jgi:hypothetical protein
MIHDLSDGAERRPQHRYLETYSLAFPFSYAILFISDLIWHINPVVLSVAQVAAWEYKITLTPDVLFSSLLTLTSLGTG